MKVVYIVTGVGGRFYCQNCLRDCALIKELRNRGIDAVMLPMYLPVESEERDIENNSRIFYGAINVYLKQKFPLFKLLPRFLQKIFDLKPFLNLAASMVGSTKAVGMEELTLSILNGEDGNQAQELDTLISWLRDSEKPDILHISNPFLLGIAGRVKDELNIPIVCSLQDESQWVDEMRPEYVDKVWDCIAEEGKDVDLFLPVSAAYGKKMQKRLEIPEDKIKTVHIGINLDGYSDCDHDASPVIGYLSRMNASLGLDILVDAFIKLKSKPEFADLKLKAIGGQTGDDDKFVAQLKQKLEENEWLDDVELIDDLSRESRLRFLSNLTLLSVPIPAGEAFGTYIIEANACGVPVVQPDIEAFSEIVSATGGGMIYSPNNPDTLAENLEMLLNDKDMRIALGKTGKENVYNYFSIGKMAENIEKIYKELCDVC